ncbi:MAG: hypothetical protein ABJN84_13600 [Flavobacteriaceae bacterium]
MNLKKNLQQTIAKMLKTLIVAATFLSLGLVLGGNLAECDKLPEDEDFFDVAESERKAMIQRYNSWHQPIARWEKQARAHIFHNKRKQVIKPEAYQRADSCYHLCKRDFDMFHEFKEWRKSLSSTTKKKTP